ncbi:hypothetical protein E1295_15780 [Nonomuraea mesophila]|uniref:Uncharacterized protein n=1 Tax=Nonomuraea mesophila TaxID=2530382 RepID=A0A4R5FMI2_9ACTN|nr:hypothetical protein [Nonomuraea mesophila]TDE54099.1 hypothetical protein E1295_15780 [Nonomuraea mesophila]
MTYAELHALVEAADQNARRVVAQAALLLDLRGRQLSALRNTYPAWDIGHQGDPSGVLWWIAELRQPVTPELVAAGVSRMIRREDAIALAATLAWQTALLHTVRPVL